MYSSDFYFKRIIISRTKEIIAFVTTSSLPSNSHKRTEMFMKSELEAHQVIDESGEKD